MSFFYSALPASLHRRTYMLTALLQECPRLRFPLDRGTQFPPSSLLKPCSLITFYALLITTLTDYSIKYIQYHFTHKSTYQSIVVRYSEGPLRLIPTNPKPNPINHNPTNPKPITLLTLTVSLTTTFGIADLRNSTCTCTCR